MKKIILIFITALLVLSGCSSNNEDNFTFITKIQGDPFSFNPNIRTDDQAWPINQNLFNRLVKLTANNTYVPDLATTWEYSDDGKALTFHLREGVKWHDGEPFSSADVKWTYDTVIEEAWVKSDAFTNVTSIETPDDYTVTFVMSEPDTSLISKLSWYALFIMPKHIYEGTDYANNPANMEPIGTGPFKFESYESGIGVTLTKNEDFYDGAPDIDTLIFQIIPDQTTAYEAFKKGEIDHLGGGLPAAYINDLDNDENYHFVEILGINRTYIIFNMEDPIVSNLKVREALAYAVDQQAVFERVGGVGRKATTMISPVFSDIVDESYTLPETNVQKAIEILESEGFTKDADGYYLQLELDGFEAGSFKEVATILASNLEKANIKLTINMSETSAWQTKVKDDGNFQMAMLAGYQGPDIAGVNARVVTGASSNFYNYSNPTLDELLAKGMQYSEIADRKPYYDQAQEIMIAELPFLPIIDNGYKYPLKNEFTGYPEEEITRASANEFTYVRRNQ